MNEHYKILFIFTFHRSQCLSVIKSRKLNFIHVQQLKKKESEKKLFSFKSIPLTTEEVLPPQTILVEPSGCFYQFTVLSSYFDKYAEFEVNPITGSG